MSDDVVIIGIGCLLPHGEGDAALDRVLAGHCAARRWPVDPRFVVGQVPDDLVPHAPGDDRAVSLALRAAELAMADAGLAPGFLAIPPERRACLFTLSKGALDVLGRAAVGTEPMNDDAWFLAADPAAAARRIASRWNLAGPTMAVVTACASGGHTLSRARSLLIDGRADLVLCGAADASLHPLILGSYRRLGLLAAADGDPSQVCRPFSGDRDGFYVGEGAAAFVLCRRSVAARLGARPRAVLAACAEGAFATDLTTVPTDGRDLAWTISLALRRAGVAPEEVDLVAVHGTATRDGDLNEVRAIRLALGTQADRVALLATKPLHGHLLGAASAVESALTVRAIETGRIPPIKYQNIDSILWDTHDLPASDQVNSMTVAVKLSAGFGGQISVSVLRA